MRRQTLSSTLAIHAAKHVAPLTRWTAWRGNLAMSAAAGEVRTRCRCHQWARIAAKVSLNVGVGFAYQACVRTGMRPRHTARVASSAPWENRGDEHRRRASDGRVTPLALRLDAEVPAPLLEGDLDLPAPHKVPHDGVGAQPGVGDRKDLRIALAERIAQTGQRRTR